MSVTDPSLRREEIDLTNCDREPIHIPGRIQPFGCLIAVSADWEIKRHSANTAEFLGLRQSSLVDCPLSDIFAATALDEIRLRLQMLSSHESVERLFGIAVAGGDALYDLALHVSGQLIVMELERHSPLTRGDQAFNARAALDRTARAETVEQMCGIAARQLRGMIGFDRVMVYRFAEDGSGEVVAEARRHDLETFLNLRYPASDIPQQARVLYTRNLLRIISNVDDTPAPLVPAHDGTGRPLDLTLSTLRAVSPIHIEYLQNMGVKASMSVSIVVRGELWGLFACHHYAPRLLSYDVRSAAELFGQLFAFLLDQKESDIEREEMERAQQVHNRLMSQIAEGATISDSVEVIANSVSSVIQNDGVAAWVEGRFTASGGTPAEDEFAGLVEFLKENAKGDTFATDRLSSVYPPADGFRDKAAGILALPMSRTPGDYLVLFRREVAQTVSWGGNPEKPVEVGPHGDRLTPRKSFELWQETVRGQSQPWTPGQVNAAEALRVTLLEVILRMSEASNRDLERADERNRLLIAELNHRVRNILTLIRGLVGHSHAEARSVDEFTDVIGGRIHALSRAHDQITRENWNPASLHELIETEAAAYLGQRATRVRIEGPDALLEPTAFTTMSLVIHEMITNSAKYGAFADSRGRIDITLAREPDGALSLDWREVGGPPVREPTRRGFGSTIIERSVPYDLGGKAEIHYDLGGVRAHFSVPPAFIAGYTKGGTKEFEPPPPADADVEGTILILEDNVIIALDAEEMLINAGASTVVLASSVAEALSVVESRDFSLALLDVNLGNETSEPVAEALRDKGIPFIFATGYGEVSGLTTNFPGVPVLQKPFAADALNAALSELQGAKG